MGILRINSDTYINSDNVQSIRSTEDGGTEIRLVGTVEKTAISLELVAKLIEGNRTNLQQDIHEMRNIMGKMGYFAG